MKPGTQVSFEQDTQYLGTSVTRGTVIEEADALGEECDRASSHPDPDNPPPSYLVQPNDPLAKTFVFCECEIEEVK